MITLKGFRYDGQTSARQAVELVVYETGLVQVRGEGGIEQFDIADIQVSPRVGRIHCRFSLPDNSSCEIEDHPQLDEVIAMLPRRSAQNLIHRLENRLHYIAIALLASIAMIYLLIQFGIPALSREVALRIPMEMEVSLGKQAMEFFDGNMCDPSKLDQSRRNQLRKYFLDSMANEVKHEVKIYFRHCPGIGENAMALPSGLIIFTDDMVKLAKDDRELLGVFAHELGHVKQRHVMRHILQNSITALLLVTLTGDIGSASSLAATLPTVLVQAKFSRQFESESDDFAARYLLKRKIRPVHLGNLLRRLEEKMGKQSELSGFISTHPLTKERYEKLKDYR